jgi:hypothetical protein
VQDSAIHSPIPLFSPTAKLLLDTSPEAVFDQFTRLAAKIFGVPVSLISVIDWNRQFFKSALGLPEAVSQARETPLTHSFCLHVVTNDSPIVVADSRESVLFRDNPSIDELGVVAYAGVPIRDGNGAPFAALCAIDSRPREWSGAELEILQMLAAQVTREVVLRENLQEMGRDLSVMKNREETRERVMRADRHDLRTPLGSLLLSIEAVRETGSLNEEQIQFLLMAERSLETVIGMVDKMIDISLVENLGTAALNLQPAEICQLVEMARYQVEPLAHRKKIHFEASADGSLAIVDGSKFVRVLVNLLANAVKFTGEGGVVKLRAGRIEESSGDCLSITVSDSGIGIPAEHLSHIFEEGYRVDRNAPTQRSTGIGLTFCKRIVESHGGTIGVKSEVGMGSVFTVLLPFDRSGSDQHPRT